MKELLETIKDSLDELKANTQDLNEMRAEKKKVLADIEKAKNEQSLYVMSSDLRKVKQEEIDKYNKKVSELDTAIADMEKKVKESFDDKKQNITKQIQEEMKRYKFAKEIDAKKAEIEKLQDRKNAYEKVAQNAKATYTKAQEKMANGDMTGFDKIQSAISEEKQNLKYVENMDKEIAEIKEEISNYIVLEENEKDYSNLEYLLMGINSLTPSSIERYEQLVNGLESQYEVDSKENKAEEKNKESDESLGEIENKTWGHYDTQSEEKNNEEVPITDKSKKFDSYDIMKNLDKVRANENGLNNIKVTVKGNSLVYSYEDEPGTEKEYSIFELKDRIKNNQFAHDPFLYKFLKTERGNSLLKEIEERQKAQEDLEEFKKYISYDMFGAENLSWRERSGLRKLAKLLKKQDFEIKNYDSIKFSFRNDVLRGIGNLFRGAMKGITGGTNTQELLEASKEKQVTDEEMKEMIEKEEIQNPNIDRLGHNTVKGEEDIKREQVEEELKNSNPKEITQDEHEIQQ